MAQIVRLTTLQQRTEREASADLARHLRELPEATLRQLPSYVRQAISASTHGLDRHARPDDTETIWPGGFTMISREQTAYVWDEIRALPSSARPNQVRHAFDLVMLNLRWDTGQVMLTRDQLAEKIGCSPGHVSDIMLTLERIGPIRRERHRIEGMRGPGRVAYFVNSHVAWMGRQAARQEAAKLDTPPLLTLMQGGKDDTPPDAS